MLTRQPFTTPCRQDSCDLCKPESMLLHSIGLAGDAGACASTTVETFQESLGQGPMVEAMLLAVSVAQAFFHHGRLSLTFAGMRRLADLDRLEMAGR